MSSFQPLPKRFRWLGAALTGLLALAAAFSLLLAWVVFTRPVQGAEFVYAVGVIVAAIQSFISAAIGMAAWRSSTATREILSLAQEDRASQAKEKREAPVRSLIDAAVEAAGHCAILVNLQMLGTKRLRVPDKSEEELRIMAWSKVVESVNVASRALTHVRWNAPESIDPATRLFDVVLRLQIDASEGRPSDVDKGAKEVHLLSEELRQAGITT